MVCVVVNAVISITWFVFAFNPTKSAASTFPAETVSDNTSAVVAFARFVFRLDAVSAVIVAVTMPVVLPRIVFALATEAVSDSVTA